MRRCLYQVAAVAVWLAVVPGAAFGEQDRPKRWPAEFFPDGSVRCTPTGCIPTELCCS